MKYSLLIFSLLFLSSACSNSSSKTVQTLDNYNYVRSLQIGGKTLMVEVAASPKEMEQGLSGRAQMENEQGMLFDFGDKPASYQPFWMKDMKFNLDLIWINKNKIVGITADVPAPKSSSDILPYYYPPSPIDEVLEVNAGWSKTNNINLGDEVKFK